MTSYINHPKHYDPNFNHDLYLVPTSTIPNKYPIPFSNQYNIRYSTDLAVHQLVNQPVSILINHDYSHNMDWLTSSYSSILDSLTSSYINHGFKSTELDPAISCSLLLEFQFKRLIIPEDVMNDVVEWSLVKQLMMESIDT
jgi:hypothetical protein